MLNLYRYVSVAWFKTGFLYTFVFLLIVSAVIPSKKNLIGIRSIPACSITTEIDRATENCQ